MIRTLKLALFDDPANSRAIGYYSTQQNFAYNAAVDVLNREPELPKRSGRNHPTRSTSASRCGSNWRHTVSVKPWSHGAPTMV